MVPIKYKTTCAIIVNEKGEILLIQRGRDPYKNHWALISGIGESKKGLPPHECIVGEVAWDLGTNSFIGEHLFSIPVEEDNNTDEVIVFRGNINESEIKIKPGYSDNFKWVTIDNLDEIGQLAFDHNEIIKRYLREFLRTN